jgi:hypothetical protein
MSSKLSLQSDARATFRASRISFWAVARLLSGVYRRNRWRVKSGPKGIVRTVSLAFWLVASASPSFAGFTVIGPTPYLSVSDSPFHANIDGSTFFLEDFEDGELNSPGILQRDLFPPEFGGAFLGTVMRPSNLTDSVDSDDGAVDGLGRQGHSFRSGVQLTTNTLPPRQQFLIQFDLLRLSNGTYPNVFGFVWTDGLEGSRLLIELTLESGFQFRSPIFQVGDSTRAGSTADDRFVGILTDEGITSAVITGGYTGDVSAEYIEIDHVQYGIIVPEPHSIVISAVSFVFVILTTCLNYGRS